MELATHRGRCGYVRGSCHWGLTAEGGLAGALPAGGGMLLVLPGGSGQCITMSSMSLRQWKPSGIT